MVTLWSPAYGDLELEKFGLEMLTSSEWGMFHPFRDRSAVMFNSWNARKQYEHWKSINEHDAEVFKTFYNLSASMMGDTIMSQQIAANEVDSVLVDEARTPLIISGAPEQAADLYQTFARLAKQLEGVETKPKLKALGETKDTSEAEYDYEYEWKKGRHHPHRGMVEARRDLYDQKRDHEEILRIADRWQRATYERNPHAQRNAERRANAWIEREIHESSRKRDHGRYVHRLHSLRRQLRVSYAWYGHGRGSHRISGHKARVFDELVQLSRHQLRRARARVRGQEHLAFAYR